MRRAAALLWLTSVLCAAAPMQERFAGESPSLARALDLALRNSPGARLADADEARAQHDYHRQRGLFLPQMAIGSGLAYSEGFPLTLGGTAPSLLNVGSSQFLFNRVQSGLLRATRLELEAVTTLRERRRQQIILDTADAYLQAAAMQQWEAALARQLQSAQRLEAVQRERIREGLASEADALRASLAAARAQLNQVEAAANRQRALLRLQHLTGVSAEQWRAADLSLAAPVTTPPATSATAPEVRQAEQHAQARQAAAEAQGRWWMPTADLVGSYGLLSRHNNYDDFYRRFQRHNVTAGLALRLPFFSPAARAQAEAAKAEAQRAQAEAQLARQQAEAEHLQMRLEVERLQMAHALAQREHELATLEADSARLRAEEGAGTLAEQLRAELALGDFARALAELELQLHRAQLQWLHRVGGLEAWAAGLR